MYTEDMLDFWKAVNEQWYARIQVEQYMERL